ncbi:alpha/beta fold hydrolase [Microvirga lenta]|uniref:alpha/beta fold hydrolase n=1 Tax=Microvirga lenta TaxID=2881337 RepID=UPI00384E564E
MNRTRAKTAHGMRGSREHDRAGRSRPASGSWLAPALIGGVAAALSATALYVHRRSKEAERLHPPIGRFIDVNGVRLHYIERGQGEPLALIHGNGSLMQDFLICGMVDELAKRYRVIVIERPGFGYSSRPRRLWTPQAQAKLMHDALQRLGVERAHVLGHSWGAMVAAALAVDFPTFVESLVLESGYFYPTPRADVLLVSPPAVPVVGDVIRHTIAPVTSSLMLPQIFDKIFDPAPVPEHFARHFPRELVLRPSHLRAASEDVALMIPSAAKLQHRYHEITAPLVIVAGAGDRIVDIERHSERLHHDVPGSEFVEMPGIGHMGHQSAPDLVIEAVERAVHRARRSRVAAPTGETVEARWP